MRKHVAESDDVCSCYGDGCTNHGVEYSYGEYIEDDYYHYDIKFYLVDFVVTSAEVLFSTVFEVLENFLLKMKGTTKYNLCETVYFHFSNKFSLD